MTRLQEILKNRITETVAELWIGELLWCVVCILVGIWFVKDQKNFVIGIICGTILAIIGIYHLWWAIDRSLDMNTDKAGKFVGTQYGVRYALLIMMVAVLYVTNWGNAFAAFFAYVGMKPAAYIQPFIHKILRR